MTKKIWFLITFFGYKMKKISWKTTVFRITMPAAASAATVANRVQTQNQLRRAGSAGARGAAKLLISRREKEGRCPLVKTFLLSTKR